MPKPVEVKALANYRIWLRDDPTFFSAVRVASHGAVRWGAGLDLCPDALYLRLTGRSPEELFPALRSAHADA